MLNGYFGGNCLFILDCMSFWVEDLVPDSVNSNNFQQLGENMHSLGKKLHHPKQI